MNFKKVIFVAGAALLIQASVSSAMAARSYTIKNGESLQSIATREYGSKQKWAVIYNANKDTISNPHMVYPGQTIMLPEDGDVKMNTRSMKRSKNKAKKQSKKQYKRLQNFN